MLSKDDLLLILQLINVAPVDSRFEEAEQQVKRLMVLRNHVQSAVRAIDAKKLDIPNE